MANYTPADFNGKTIAKLEVIKAEFGRTYQKYLCFTFTDGTRVMLAGDLYTHSPDPEPSEMRKAPMFFTPEDIAAKVLRDEQDKRARMERERQAKLAQIERLQRELDG